MNIQALLGIDTASHDKLWNWAHQVQQEMNARNKVVLTDASLSKIAARMREQTCGWARFEDDETSYDDIFDFTITVQGVDLYVAYGYHAERSRFENRFPEWGATERVEALSFEGVCDILVEPVEDTCDVVFDEKKLKQYFK